VRVRIPPRALNLRSRALLDSLLTFLTGPALPVLLAYGAIGGAYLLVMPLVLILWMNRRWHEMGKIERTAIYGLVFLFFPGLILFAPFINLRMAGQGEA
jgi:NAD(P)H-quinone oxidoreductase subunit L